MTSALPYPSADHKPAQPRRRVLITGAAGAVGTALWPRLAVQHDVGLTDLVPLPELIGPGFSPADIADLDTMTEIMTGVDCVVHLAANPNPGATWPELVPPNILGCQTVFEAAVQAEVATVVFASSCHAAGRYDVERYDTVDPAWPPRPCCLYGASKAAGESLARHYSDCSDLRVICLRLGWFSERPVGLLGLKVWLSPGDLDRAVSAAISAKLKFGVYYAVSANSRLHWQVNRGISELGFRPLDNAEDYVDQIDPRSPGPLCYQGAA